MEDNLKIVHHIKYCKKCKHWKKKDHEEPCNECLGVPARYDGSHEPVKYEEKK